MLKENWKENEKIRQNAFWRIFYMILLIDFTWFAESGLR